MGGGEEAARENGRSMREQTWHKRADAAQESRRGTKGQQSRSEQRQNDKKKTYMSCGQTGAVTKALTQLEEARRGVDEVWSGWCRQSMGMQHNRMGWCVSCK